MAAPSVKSPFGHFCDEGERACGSRTASLNFAIVKGWMTDVQLESLKFWNSFVPAGPVKGRAVASVRGAHASHAF